MPGGFAFDKLIPMQVGQAHRVRRGTNGMQFVEYSIDNCPFATPLRKFPDRQAKVDCSPA